MFEQQIEETISSVKRRTIGDNSSITLKAILEGDIPEAIKTYFNLDVKQWMKEEHDRLLNSPHFDYSDEEVRRKFRDIEQLSRPMIRFTEEEFDTVLDQAVKLYFNYVCRPQWTLSKFVFGEKDLVTSDAVLEALEYFVEYEYFRLIIAEYLKNKGYTSMHHDRFEELVATIDSEVTKGFDSRKMAQLAQPLFSLFSGESDTALIPIEALSVFYDDKNVSSIVERLDAEKDSMPMLSMHDLTVLISEVDFSTSEDISNLVNRHLYPERKPAQPETGREPSDEEITRSIIEESRGAQAREEENLQPPEDFAAATEASPEPDASALHETEEAPDTFSAETVTGTEPDIRQEQLPDFQVEEEQPEEAAIPEREETAAGELPEIEEETIEEEELPEFRLEEEPEEQPYEEAEIPSFERVPEIEDRPTEEPAEEFSFSTAEEPGETEEEELPTDFSFQDEEQPSDETPAEEKPEDMDLPEEFEGFTLESEDREEEAPEAVEEEDGDTPDEFEGLTLASGEEHLPEQQSLEEDEELPEFPGFSLEREDEAIPSFSETDELLSGGEHETPEFDEFLPVEDDSTPEMPVPEGERLESETQGEDEDVNLNFSLGSEETDETEMIQDKNEPESFDTFLSDLDEAAPSDETPQEPDEGLSFLEGIGEEEAPAADDAPPFEAGEPASTPGDEFSFEGDFTPPESDVSYEEHGKLVQEEQKNEYSTEDETHFTEFEFEPPDDESLILPELDLSLDESENERAEDDDISGFDFGEALAGEQEEETTSDEMKDLMKDFARDQSTGAGEVDDPVAALGDLKQTIPAKDRKNYIKSLFNKDEQAFEEALGELNRKRTWREASEYIDELFIEHDVDMYSKVAIKFTDEIYKRYMPQG